MLLLGGLKLVLRSGVFTKLDFYEVDLSLVRCKLFWSMGSGCGCTAHVLAGAAAKC